MTGVKLSFELSSHLKRYDNAVPFENNSILWCKFFFEWKVVLNFQWEMKLTFWPALFDDASEGLAIASWIWQRVSSFTGRYFGMFTCSVSISVGDLVPGLSWHLPDTQWLP